MNEGTASLRLEAGRAVLEGTLGFSTVTALLPIGTQAISAGEAQVIDLAQVGGVDSAGLALLIEWLSVARAAGRTLRYERVPTAMLQLARLSDVESLLLSQP
jgi:phospholipid transport system transporter-binding protein